MNRLYEIGTTADVLIRCKSSRTIGAKTYVAGEPYTLLKDVVVSLDYAQNITEESGKKPVFATQKTYPKRLAISGVPFTTKIVDLILSLVKKDNGYNRTVYKRLNYDEDGIYLDNDMPVAKNSEIFVYDAETKERIDVTANEDGTILVGDNLVDEKYYNVFYEYAQPGDLYSFDMPTYGYFTLEITMMGNIDKNGSDHKKPIYLKFDAASLVAVPNFDVGNEGILNTPLVFELIYRGQEEPVIVL